MKRTAIAAMMCAMALMMGTVPAATCFAAEPAEKCAVMMENTDHDNADRKMNSSTNEKYRQFSNVMDSINDVYAKGGTDFSFVQAADITTGFLRGYGAEMKQDDYRTLANAWVRDRGANRVDVMNAMQELKGSGLMKFDSRYISFYNGVMDAMN